MLPLVLEDTSPVEIRTLPDTSLDVPEVKTRSPLLALEKAVDNIRLPVFPSKLLPELM